MAMAQIQSANASMVDQRTTGQKTAAIDIPPSSMSLPETNAARLRNRMVIDTYSPVHQNGCFEFDRVIKSGYVHKRTQKTKAWKSIYLVLRPNTLSIYKTDKEDRLRHKVYLSDLTAVALLKDPKQKRDHVFGLFSPSKNFHFQASSARDAQEWVDVIRKDARIEEEEEEMLLASPTVRRESFFGMRGFFRESNRALAAENDRLGSSSPEPLDQPISSYMMPSSVGRPSQYIESSGMSGNELASHSDFSDTDIQRIHGASIESLAVQSPGPTASQQEALHRPSMADRNGSQNSGINIEQDPDRVAWQGRLWFLRSKRGVRQWKDTWAVLRPRNLILYKNTSEYSALSIFPLSSIVDVVDIDPVSKSKTNCLQLITEEKSYRFCAHDEEALVQCLGAFKSLLSKRKELELRAAATTV